MEIFAIGHSNYPYDKLINMIKKYDINCVVDIRETPYSKYNIQYNKEAFNESLRNSGFLYIYMGKEFGAKRTNKDVYTQEGYADFEKVAKKIFFKRNRKIKKGCQMGYRIVLLGAMQEPIRCHRSILVGKVLNKEGFDVKYIMHEGNLAYQEDIEESLLDKYFSDRKQLSIDNLLGSALTREEMIQEGYKLANKEIGYRTEKLGK
ncbi:DUF488 domain-containing protein [Clostridioides difficile]|nr:DUF488 domain-containing protein [Clostridioides difficile]